MAIRWLLVCLLAALVTLGGSLSGAGSLTSRFWPPDPTEDELADLAEEYEVIQVGAQECGQGGSYQCGWSLVIAHDRTHEELEAEIQRVTEVDLNGRLVIDDLAPGQSQVEVSWGARDPGPWEFFGVLGLLLVALVNAVLAFVLLLAIVVRSVASLRA